MADGGEAYNCDLNRAGLFPADGQATPCDLSATQAIIIYNAITYIKLLLFLLYFPNILLLFFVSRRNRDVVSARVHTSAGDGANTWGKSLSCDELKTKRWTDFNRKWVARPRFRCWWVKPETNLISFNNLTIDRTFFILSRFVFCIVIVVMLYPGCWPAREGSRSTR